MKKLLFLSMALLASTNIFGAANRGSEHEKTEFSITITNKSGDPLELRYGFFNVPITFASRDYRMAPNASITIDNNSHLVDYGFKQTYAKVGPEDESMEWAPGTFAKMDGDENFEIVKKTKNRWLLD